MSLAIVESLPCGVVSTRPSARDGRAPPPCSCPTATTPSRGRNVRGRRGGGPPADHASGSGSSARRALSLSLPECQIIISTRGRRVLTLRCRRTSAGRSALVVAASLARHLHRHEGHGRVVLVALTGLTGADLRGKGLRGLRVLLVALEHDRLLLGVVGSGEVHILPAVPLEGVAPGTGQTVLPAGVDHPQRGRLVGLRRRLLGGLAPLGLLTGGRALRTLGSRGAGGALGAVVAGPPP